MDVMFYEVFKEEEEALKKFLPKNIKAGFTSQTIQAAGGKNPPAEVISIRTQSKIPGNWAAKGLRAILTRSTGYDHLLEYRRQTRSRVACGYLGDYCASAVAEQAMVMIGMLLRRMKKQIKNFENFDRNGLTGGEFRARRLLVVGVGNIGKQVVEIGQGLRMDVRGVDIKRNMQRLKYVSLNNGAGWADVIICAAPLTAKTRGMLDYALFKKARPGLVLVNVSRGEISPIKDLAKLLKQGKLGGLGLDVFEEEADLAESL